MDVNFLKDNPVFWTRAGFACDPPLYGENGRPLLFEDNFKQHAGYVKSFTEKGVKICSSIIHLGWMGVDTYDYSATDETLDGILGSNPDVYYLPRIKLNVPVDWCRENPEEIFLYEGAPRTPEKIAALVGTDKHDWLGYEAPNGYYMGSDKAAARPNVGGLAARQSFSSKKWLADAGEALKNFIDHIRAGKYADRIIGYHLAFGTSGECVLWGRISERYGDYGLENLRCLYDFGMKKYGSREALSKAWNQPGITRDTVRLPSADERYRGSGSLKELFRDNEYTALMRDYDEFISEVAVEAIEYFGKIVKSYDENYLTGCFYGYFLHVANAAYAGHTAMDRLLSSEYIDFLAGPMSYYRRRIGEPGGELCPAQSVNRKKLWLDEIDCRTMLATVEKDTEWYNPTLEATSWTLWRDVCRNISHNSGYWYMDLGGGWYGNEQLMDEIEKLNRFAEGIRRLPYRSGSDVLVIYDEKSHTGMKVNHELLTDFCDDFNRECNSSGALVDYYRLEDVKELDLSRYKLVIFAYTFVTDERIKKIQLPEKATVMFNYATGIIENGNASCSNVERLTGFKVTEYNDPTYPYPMLKISGTEEKLSKKEINGRTHILNVSPKLNSAAIRQIARDAGCRIYADSGCVVYGDARFIGLFSTSDSTKIFIPDDCDYTDAVSGKVYKRGKAYRISKNEKAILIAKNQFPAFA